MDKPTPRPSETYEAWAPIYDRTFGALAAGARRRAMTHLDLRSGQRVLDLGIGTGATLEDYPDDAWVVGVDLSQGMLDKAARRLCRGPGPGPRGRHLVRADAQLPPFADHQFDHVLLTHVISVVDDPAAVMQRVARLVKPDGSVLIVNHFRDPDSSLSGFKKFINPLCIRIGWRSDLTLADCLRDVPLSVEVSARASAFDLWRVVRLRPVVADAAEPAAPARRPLADSGSDSSTGTGYVATSSLAASIKPSPAVHIR